MCGYISEFLGVDGFFTVFFFFSWCTCFYEKKGFLCVCVCVCVYICVYVYVCVCMCMCVCVMLQDAVSIDALPSLMVHPFPYGL